MRLWGRRQETDGKRAWSLPLGKGVRRRTGVPALLSDHALYAHRPRKKEVHWERAARTRGAQHHHISVTHTHVNIHTHTYPAVKTNSMTTGRGATYLRSWKGRITTRGRRGSVSFWGSTLGFSSNHASATKNWVEWKSVATSQWTVCVPSCMSSETAR